MQRAPRKSFQGPWRAPAGLPTSRQSKYGKHQGLSLQVLARHTRNRFLPVSWGKRCGLDKDSPRLRSKQPTGGSCWRKAGDIGLDFVSTTWRRAMAAVTHFQVGVRHGTVLCIPRQYQPFLHAVPIAVTQRAGTDEGYPVHLGQVVPRTAVCFSFFHTPGAAIHVVQDWCIQQS